jgi:hypothetical protein
MNEEGEVLEAKPGAIDWPTFYPAGEVIWVRKQGAEESLAFEVMNSNNGLLALRCVDKTKLEGGAA